MADLKLAVSIVCFQTPRREIVGLLDSLAAACECASAILPAESVAIIIIDNGGTKSAKSTKRKESAEQLSAADLAQLLESSPLRGCESRLLRGHGNIGYGAGQNLAIRDFQADYHLLLNPDVEFEPGALLAGLRYLEQFPGAVLASPAASDRGERQFLCKRYPSVLTLFLRGFVAPRWHSPFAGRLAAYEFRDLPEDRPSDDVLIASGCCMLCRGAPLREAGGFDERFFLYFEDFDLSLRLARFGKLAHVPAMRIRHRGGNAAGKGLAHVAMFARSAWKFFNRHGWSWF